MEASVDRVIIKNIQTVEAEEVSLSASKPRLIKTAEAVSIGDSATGMVYSHNNGKTIMFFGDDVKPTKLPWKDESGEDLYLIRRQNIELFLN